jgi:hypothetical protein
LIVLCPNRPGHSTSGLFLPGPGHSVTGRGAGRLKDSRPERPDDFRRFKVYEFAIVVLLGIGTFKLVDMLNEYVDLSKVQSLLTIALGAVVAWALEFSLFT